MKHFLIPTLTENEINEQTAKIGTIQTYGDKSKSFTFTEGHKREYALQKFFNPAYVFQKDTRPFHTFSDIATKKASVKSPNCTLFVDGKIINDTTTVQDATNYYLTTCVSTTYYMVIKPTKWYTIASNQYMVIELTKQEMQKLLTEYGTIDRDSRAHTKNCLRIKRTDDVIAKWYKMNRI